MQRRPRVGALFQSLSFDRKTAAYQKAIGMAQLLLLRFHPDVRKGSSDVLALMFDMNQLWEKYVFRMLRKELASKPFIVREQVRNLFWKQDGGSTRIIKPDIVVYSDNGGEVKTIAVLDTKWKRLNNARVDDADLKQMLVYNLYNHCERSALVYPASGGSKEFQGTYLHYGSTCSAIFLAITKNEEQGMKIELGPLTEWIECMNHEFFLKTT